MRRSTTLILATAAGALALTGTSAANRQAISPDTFVYASQNSIVTDFDPATSYSNENIAMNNVYEQLTRYDAKSRKVKPLLAKSWSRSKNGQTWTFNLRSGVKFHSGRPLTAAAAKAAIMRTKTLKGGAAYIWDSVKSI